MFRKSLNVLNVLLVFAETQKTSQYVCISYSFGKMFVFTLVADVVLEG